MQDEHNTSNVDGGSRSSQMQPPSPGPVQPNPNLGSPGVSPVSPTGQGPSGFERQRKMVIIVAAIISLIAVGIAGAVLFSSGGVDPRVEDVVHGTEEVTEIEAINILDNKFGKGGLSEEDMGFQNGNPNIPVLYASFDESSAYFIDKPEEWRYYKLDNVLNYTNIHLDGSGSSSECNRFMSNNHDKIITLVNIMKDEGFSYKQPKPSNGRSSFYSQQPVCDQGGMFISQEYICSTKFDAIVRTENNDGTSDVVPGIGVACSSVESLEEKLENARVSKQIAIDNNLPSDGLIPLPTFVRDSITAGYKIAEVVTSLDSSWHYKKGDYPWVSTVSSLCSDIESSSDARLAFKGEECQDGQGGSRIVS